MFKRRSAYTKFNQFLKHQNNLDLLRFITCGSVDNGKSTLIGRLLWDSKQILEDQMATLKQESIKYSTQKGKIDLALLLDGLTAEREQGITIDVAYHYFTTDSRKFIVADTPGHEQYTRNMVTGASTADVAVILVDASVGILTQTRRHAYLVSLMGIRHVVLAVNKMDLVNYDSTIFWNIKKEFEHYAQALEFLSITAIPLSALNGDNVTKNSPLLPWYSGPSLIKYLETIEIGNPFSGHFAFPVQQAIRPNSSFRGFSGTVSDGIVRIGDEIRVTSSGQVSNVARIVTMNGDLEKAQQGQAITLTLTKEIDISRGDVLSLAQYPLEITDQFEAVIVWMAEENGLIGRTYDLKLATQETSASITSIKHKIDVDTLAHEAAKKLVLNDICYCNIATSKPLAFDLYTHSKTLGGFILVDRFNHATVALGMIRHSLRRAQNVHRQSLTIQRADREKLNGHKSKVIWFTGLSGSGKSTLANAAEIALHERGWRTYIMDGDNIRQGLNRDLGFTDSDRVENIRRVIEVGKLMLDAGLVVITAFISPFRREREMARELIGPENFIEVYVNTPLEICEERDIKGLYKKARNGQLPNFSGISSPYEPPENPDLILDGSSKDIKPYVNKILSAISSAK